MREKCLAPARTPDNGASTSFHFDDKDIINYTTYVQPVPRNVSMLFSEKKGRIFSSSVSCVENHVEEVHFRSIELNN